MRKIALSVSAITALMVLFAVAQERFFSASVNRQRQSAEAADCLPRPILAGSYAGPLFDAHLHMPIFFDFATMMDHGPSNTGMGPEGHGPGNAGMGMGPMMGPGRGNVGRNMMGPPSTMGRGQGNFRPGMMGDGHENVSMGDGTDPVLDKDVMLTDILCMFEKERSRGAIGFTMAVPQMADDVVAMARSVLERAGDKIHLFLATPTYDPDDLESIADPDLFDGIGEVAMYLSSMQGQQPDNARFSDVYKLAEKHDYMVMIHSGHGQERAVENAVRLHPKVRFLFHGPELENSIHGIIAKYPNAYYSIDTMLIRLPGVPGGLMYMSRNKEEFKQKFTQNYDTMMNEALRLWKSRIEQYPDRYVWGTDRAYDWMYDDEVSERIEKFSRDFIGKLAPAAQEKFAYTSAEKLLQK